MKTIKAVTATRIRWFNKRPPSYTLATLQCTCRVSLSRSVLLSRDKRNWATALSASSVALTIDRCSYDYVTVFHLTGRLCRVRSHALLMQTMQLCSLLNACPCGTMTDRIANARKLNLNSNLEIELRIFELRLTTLLEYICPNNYFTAKH